ncbi:MAG: hypothetical protein IPJ84_03180 [Bdellovibrionales bacterium]|nr:hypothetical protein [Bdellovibrionales bacterium]
MESVDDVKTKIGAFVKNYLELRGAPVTEVTMTQFNGDVFDSLFQVEIILFLEATYKIEFVGDLNDSDIFKSIDSVAATVNELRREK